MSEDELRLIRELRDRDVQWVFAFHDLSQGAILPGQGPFELWHSQFPTLVNYAQTAAYVRHIEALGLIDSLTMKNDFAVPAGSPGGMRRFYFDLVLSDFGLLFAAATLPTIG